MQLVVSRYNENVEWTKQFPNVIIYNKGEPLSSDYNEIRLLNVGREAHTFYYHIYTNYDNLHDNIIFVQGDPFDHCKDALNQIMKMIDNPRQFGNFQFMSDIIHNLQLSNENMYDHNMKIHHIPLQKVYNHLFNVYQLHNIEFKFGVGAQFMVSKERILSHSRDFYSKVIKILDYTKSPIEGYVMERLHGYIFQYDNP